MMLQFEDSGLDYFSFFSHQKLHFIACKKEVVLISYVCELLKVWRENWIPPIKPTLYIVLQHPGGSQDSTAGSRSGGPFWDQKPGLVDGQLLLLMNNSQWAPPDWEPTPSPHGPASTWNCQRVHAIWDNGALFTLPLTHVSCMGICPEGHGVATTPTPTNHVARGPLMACCHWAGAEGSSQDRSSPRHNWMTSLHTQIL